MPEMPRGRELETMRKSGLTLTDYFDLKEKHGAQFLTALKHGHQAGSAISNLGRPAIELINLHGKPAALALSGRDGHMALKPISAYGLPAAKLISKHGLEAVHAISEAEEAHLDVRAAIPFIPKALAETQRPILEGRARAVFFARPGAIASSLKALLERRTTGKH